MRRRYLFITGSVDSIFLNEIYLKIYLVDGIKFSVITSFDSYYYLL